MSDENGDKRSGLGDFLSRTPFAIIGAFGLVSLASGVIQLEQNIADWVHVWESVTRPIWQYSVGWLLSMLGLLMPYWLMDYFTLGLISVGMYIRSYLFVISYYRKTTESQFWAQLEADLKKPYRDDSSYTDRYRSAVEKTYEQNIKEAARWHLVTPRTLNLPIALLFSFLLWPLLFFTFTVRAVLPGSKVLPTLGKIFWEQSSMINDPHAGQYALIKLRKIRFLVYAESLVYALIIIAASYALIFGGAPTAPAFPVQDFLPPPTDKWVW